MRELPNSPIAERCIIGNVILEKHLSPGFRERLLPEHFYDPRLRCIYRAILELDRDGVEIDPFAIQERVNRQDLGDMQPVKTTEIAETVIGSPPGIEMGSYVRSVLDAASRRHLIRELETQIERISKRPMNEIISSLKSKLDDFDTSPTGRGRFCHVSEIIDKEVDAALAALHAAEGTGDSMVKIPTGFSIIDRELGGGISFSDVLLVAGLPGSGKSAFVLQAAASIASKGFPVAFVSGEMSNKENVLRLLSQMSRMTNLNSVSHITRSELETLREWAQVIRTLPLYFDSKTFDLSSLSRSIGSLVEEQGVKALVVDYIQLLQMDTYEKRASRYERITEVSQEIKRLAMRYEIAVIVVAQFNREGAKSGRPSIHDLEGTSQLEKDASLIFILDQEKHSHTVTLRIEKGRNSGLCELTGTFDGRVLSFKFD